MNHALGKLRRQQQQQQQQRHPDNVRTHVQTNDLALAPAPPPQPEIGRHQLQPPPNGGSIARGNATTLAEKTLPPGAAIYEPSSSAARSHDAAFRDRDELDRALRLSREEAEYNAALQQSRRQAEDEERRRQKLADTEEAVPRQSVEEQRRIIEAEEAAKAQEEEAILQAIRESQAEASKSQKGKGRQTRDEEEGSTGDEELERVMLLSLQEQEQQYRAAQVYGQDDPARSSTQSASPSGVRSHQNASPRPYRPPPAPPRPTLFPAGSQQTNSPASHEQHPPFTRRQPHPSSSGTSYDVEGVLPQDAPPAYEASSSMSVSHPSSTTSSATDPSLMSPYTHPSTAGNSQQPLSPQEEAARLEEKRLVYYPPIADNEMAEGSMRAFVPHMLFAARARGAMENTIPTIAVKEDSSSTSTSTAIVGTPRTRRPLPPLPADAVQQPFPEEKVKPHIARDQSQHPSPSPAMSVGSPTKSAGGSNNDAASTAAPSFSTHMAVENESRQDVLIDAAHPRDTGREGPQQDEDDEDPFADSNVAEDDAWDDEDEGSGYDNEVEERERTDSESEYYYSDRATADSHRALSSHSSQRSGKSSSSEHDAHNSGSSKIKGMSGIPEQDENGTPVHVIRERDYAAPREASPAPRVQIVEDAPRVGSPEPMDEPPSENGPGTNPHNHLRPEANYETDQSCASWESTASEYEDEDDSFGVPRSAAKYEEMAHNINTNVSFGFNPLSSPNQYLEYQGRFPDVVVLSRYADEDAAAVVNDPSVDTTTKNDYRTFAFEAPTWRELIAYLMWHGNSVFKASDREIKESKSPFNPLEVSLIVEFVKNAATSSTLVRLQIHLLSGLQTAESAPSTTATGGGVALSRRPLSGRPMTPQASAATATAAVVPKSPKAPSKATANAASTHLVLAFPKPYHTLPFTLSTIGSHMHNAHKAALANEAGASEGRSVLASGVRRMSSTFRADPSTNRSAFQGMNEAFLHDLLKGVRMCSDAPSQDKTGDFATDDTRMDRLVKRLKHERLRLRGTFKELNRRSSREYSMHAGTLRLRRRRESQAKRRASNDSALESQPQDQDYHITPFKIT